MNRKHNQQQPSSRIPLGFVVFFLAAAFLAAVVNIQPVKALFYEKEPQQGAKPALAVGAAITPKLDNELPANSSAGGLWPGGGQEDWIIAADSDAWTTAELETVRVTLSNTMTALEEAGFDGQALLAGYRFRRYHGEFIDGVDGRIALVRHGAGEVILADTAFKRLWGFYIYHELGHVVDKRLERQLSNQFHALIAAETSAASPATADGFWLNEHARGDREEATADAFALWIILRYTENPKPVFWGMANTTDYDAIVDTLDAAIGNAIQANG